MAKDYKNAGKKKPKRQPIPGWLWMLTGLSIGLLVALLVYLAQQPPGTGATSARARIITPAPARHAKTPAAKHAAAKPAGKNGAAAHNGVRYEFYTLLPESEVVIPDQELAEHSKGAKSKAKPPGTYMLQAGSFRNPKEAKTRKGELALLGIVASIQNVTIGGDTWYRVRVGPFATFGEINRVRNRLQDNNINAIPVKIKG
ncbi:MAG: SPOR domain-containing protein [Gammaproteobacteria bacterium]